jgi:2-C-methyl-D-erythritol 2,4-cyclodiphosphate synthase
MLRIGQGYDVHRFTDGDHLMLCGVRIPFEKRFLAHSDGDVALHALSDALLGAAGLGDIGKHFPDTDPTYKGIDSRILLRQVQKSLQDRGYEVGNIDLTIVAQRPKLAGHIQAMRSNVAEDLAIDIEQVNVKATTTEGLGFEGREEGISAFAIALIQRAP